MGNNNYGDDATDCFIRSTMSAESSGTVGEFLARHGNALGAYPCNCGGDQCTGLKLGKFVAPAQWQGYPVARPQDDDDSAIIHWDRTAITDKWGSFVVPA